MRKRSINFITDFPISRRSNIFYGSSSSCADFTRSNVVAVVVMLNLPFHPSQKAPRRGGESFHETHWKVLENFTLVVCADAYACVRARKMQIHEVFQHRTFFLLPLEASHLQFFGCCRSARSIILYVFLDSVKPCGNKIKSRFYFLCSKLRLLRSSHFSTCFVCCNSDTLHRVRVSAGPIETHHHSSTHR